MPTAITCCWDAEEAYSSLEFVTWPDHLSLRKKQKLPCLVAPLCKDKLETQAAKGQLRWDVFLTPFPVPWTWHHAVLQVPR